MTGRGIHTHVFVLVVIFCAPFFSHAATIESTGNFGYWYIGSTWIGGQVPGANDDVVINGTVQALFPRTVNNLTVSPGASMTVTSGAGEININGVLNNQGTFNHSGASVNLYGGFRGVPTSHTLEWYAGEGIWEPDQPTSLVLRSNFITGTSTVFGTLIPNGNYVSAYAQPVISISSTGGNQLTVLGDSTINITGQPAFAPLNAVDSDVVWTTGGQSYGTHTANTLTLIDTATPYNINTGVTITTDQLMTASGTIITSATGASGGYTNNLVVTGDIKHNGLLDNRVNLLVGGNVRGTGAYQNTPFFDQRGTHRFTWSNTGTHYEYIIADSLPKLSSATPTVTTVPYTGDIRSQLTSYQPHYLVYRVDGERWSNPRTIYVEPDPVTTPEDFFSFDLIQDVELPNQADVTIYAKDPAFSGPVTLSGSQGRVYPVVVSINDGQWSGQVEFFEPVTNQMLYVSGTASAVGERGESNQFNVTDSVMSFGIVKGTVSNLVEPVPNHLVTFSDNRGSLYTATTTSNGEYAVTLPTGDYVIGGSDINDRIIVGADRAVDKDINLFSETTCNTNKVPVLLIPGIQGSDRVGHLGWFPELYRHTPRWDSGELEIHDPLGQVGFGTLQTKFISEENYQINCDLFTVPYDWSISVVDAAAQYLKPWIDHAKLVSGQEQVDIVAHSMGGLVTRTYIQGNNYGHDIRKFAMVGTPNQGSVQAYFSWEGGDPIQADTYGGDWFQDLGAIFAGAYQFQTNTLNTNFKIKTGNDDACYNTGLLSSTVDFTYWQGNFSDTCNNIVLRDFLRSQAPSVGELYPTYDFLRQPSFAYPITGESVYPNYENTMLKALNNEMCGEQNDQSCGYSFTPLDQRAATSTESMIGVHIKLFTGLETDFGEPDYSTPAYVFVESQVNPQPYYTDGTLVRVDQNLGDGTVLQSSVVGNVSTYLDTEEVNRAHAGLVSEYRDEIINFITD